MNITQLVTGPLSVNTWIIPLDSVHCVVVDPGGDADIIITHLEELHLVPALVVLTHGHFDHIGALPELLRAFPSLQVAIHSADAFFLGEGAVERHTSFFTTIGALSLIKQFHDAFPPASVLLAEGMTLSAALAAAGTKTGGGDWTFFHTPGHSAGSVCLYSAAKRILVSGDTLFNTGVGRTDMPGGNPDELYASLARLARLPPETDVLPGHGPRTTIGGEFC